MLTVSLLDAQLFRCRSSRHLLQIHAQFLASGLLVDAFAASCLLLFTTSARLLPRPFHHSLDLFRLVRSPNAFTCNTLLKVAMRQGLPHFCLPFNMSMPVPSDAYTHPLLTAACAARGNMVEGLQVHLHAFRHGFGDNVYLRNTLMHMYSACRRVPDARRVFDAGIMWVTVSWNTILAVYVWVRDVDQASRVFARMPERSSVAVSSMVALFTRREMVDEEKRVFDGAKHMDAFTWTAMVT